ncbi:uncharacterized protein FIBRA_02561 [Fibroporia radiculosa]|uniref:ATPase AAA-type core domain-containing protein n=1 Tax=Fibroporia radiculosa TaxID=599839 RepID=J4HV49_9APHY|nr:uncharacterized protein FIBRA_02561 [Fibroporia radiculosa]CCM00527.1 predicted protein [Fibroporia radiculosa]
MEDTEFLAFGLPGALLADDPSLDNASQHSTSGGNRFSMGGLLLNEESSSENLRSNQCRRIAQIGPECVHKLDGSATRDVFVLNGLLCESVEEAEVEGDSRAPRATETVVESVSSQSQEFPEIRDLLRPYARAHAGLTESHSSYKSSTPPLSLRASTFDGQTVFLRRKSRRKECGASHITADPTSGGSGTGRQYYSKLLDVPIHRLLDQLATETAMKFSHSDARSAQVIEERLRPILETGCTVGSTKPTLAVIDEIDGATGGSDNSAGFIQKLISLTYDKPRKKGRKIDPKASRPLLRPIICICNDLYASSLTKLRAYARVIRFSRPNDIHLVRRLRDICEIEGLRTESRALTTLVGVAQGDLRGCLNMLQLMKARGRDVTEPAVRTATAGMKETEASQTSVLNDLFTPMPRRRAKELGITEEEEARYVGRLSREIESSGTLDRIASGKYPVPSNYWLTAYDVMSGEMWSEREYALMQYLPYMLVAFYPLFQERGGCKVERPKVDYENYVITKANEEIYKSLVHCLCSAAARNGGDYRHFASESVLRLEFVPLVNRIISPPLKPASLITVNRQIIRPGERAVLDRLVNIMVSMELRFVQEKMEDGQLMFRLDPPIDVFVTYDGKRAADIAVSKYAVRHLVATEIDARLVSIQADAVERSKPSKASFFKKGSKNRDADEEEPELITSKRVRQEQSKPEEKIAVDFFGRPITSASGSNNKKPASKKVIQQYRVKFRFREGNSAAVRKQVKVGAFL